MSYACASTRMRSPRSRGRQSSPRLELQPSRRYGRRRRRDRRVRDAGSGVDLSLVKTLMREELGNDGIELGAVLSEQSPCFGIALVRNPPDFLVHGVEQPVRDLSLIHI